MTLEKKLPINGKTNYTTRYLVQESTSFNRIFLAFMYLYLPVLPHV